MKKTVSMLLGVAVAAASCSENDIPLYSGPAAINLSYDQRELYGSYTETADISFLALAQTESSYEFTVYATVVGGLSGESRTFRLRAVDPEPDSERHPAEANVDFSFPAEVTVPAGASGAEFTITVNKANTGNIYKTFIAVVAVEPGGDFVPGPSSSVSATFSEIFPSEWYSSNGNENMGMTGYLMGACTPDKYRFVYEFYGSIDLVYWARGWMDWSVSAFVDQLNAALDGFERENGYRLLDTSVTPHVEMNFSPAT